MNRKEGKQEEMLSNNDSNKRTLECDIRSTDGNDNDKADTNVKEVKFSKRLKVVDSTTTPASVSKDDTVTTCPTGKNAGGKDEEKKGVTNVPTPNCSAEEIKKPSSGHQTQQYFNRLSAQSTLFSTNEDFNLHRNALLSTSSMPNIPLPMRMTSPLLFFSSSCRGCSERCHRENGGDGETRMGNGADNCHQLNTLAANMSCIPTITDKMAQLFQSYYSSCALYNCQPNPGVLVAIRYSLPSLRVSGSFHDADMLALSEVLIPYANTPLLSHVKRLDFGRASLEGKLHGIKGFKSHGAFALSRVLLASKHISEVFVQRHRIGPYGAAAIFAACKENSSVKVLVLRRCLIGVRGAQAFALCVASKNCGLREVDLSNCRMGYLGTRAVCNALSQRKQHGLPSIDVDIEGNLIIQEVSSTSFG